MGGTHFLQTGYLLLNRNAPFKTFRKNTGNISNYSYFFDIITIQTISPVLRKQFPLPLDHLINLLNIQSHILHIVTPLDSSVGEDSLGDASGA